MKEDKRYKPLQGKTVKKARPIMYASHRDACILSAYSHTICRLLDAWYDREGLSSCIIAYRALGRANYDFARSVEDYIRAQPKVTVLCFDVSGFFDNLEHARLKERLRWLLGVNELGADWYRVFRHVTKYRYVRRDDLLANDTFAQRYSQGGRKPLATMKELNAADITINPNPAVVGIPQGTPIIAALSNLYMTAFDAELHAAIKICGGLYQRYSDDILIACPPEISAALELLVASKLSACGLQLQAAKTERRTFSGVGAVSIQYLGFNLGHNHARIRPGSLARQWRKAKRAVRGAEGAGAKAMAAGKAKKIYLRKLHRKFMDPRMRNFMNYANRSQEALASPAIRRQLKRLRKYIASEMVRLKT
ncbi:hypothetical protein M2333_001822 [Sphingobium sp. B11D3B]|uniref:reverse transcriptase domain-containing protein n=1 Tax=Sphingobium sp. B11D3B TaxID=2940575 RepID=UPI002227B362|nr:reverse transcriptase domain-containing protein [Sphingobium sp. B11D3B]MCW2388776.1 hypothetical protein [Sphingobium sp. B11D3B]